MRSRVIAQYVGRRRLAVQIIYASAEAAVAITSSTSPQILVKIPDRTGRT